MSKKLVQKAAAKTVKVDKEVKGKKRGHNKKTNQGNSKNTKATTKNSVRERKGR